MLTSLLQVYKWNGKYIDGFRKGPGRLEYLKASDKPGVVYEGEFAKDLLVSGSYTNPLKPPKGDSMRLYVGPMVDGKPSTANEADASVTGRAEWHDGNRYTGLWLMGKPHGMGAGVYPDVSTYK